MSFSVNDRWVATSNAFPLHPFAAEQNVKVLQESAKNYSLEPAGFQDVIPNDVEHIRNGFICKINSKSARNGFKQNKFD